MSAMTFSSARRLALTLLLACASSPALAHAHLVSAAPAANAAASAPTRLTLKFSEAIELNLSGVTLAGPGGAVATGAASLDAKDGVTLTVPLDAPLAAGKYHVEWHVLARDGHRTKGAYDFTVAP